MSFEDYYSALKQGQKEYRQCVSRGEYPYLQVLDDILNTVETQGEVSLGLVNIPIDRLVGTKTAGRRTAFARNFMPLLDVESEFAVKWINLSEAHLEEGIRDPIIAYEFMNQFYVVEGNKRVSVLKFFGAVSVPGTVTRVMPKRTDSPESIIYYEFVDFYRVTQINYLWFSQPGRFKSLLALVDASGEPWTPEQRSEFYCAYALFKKAFDALGGARPSITTGDAMLAYLKIYGYAALLDSSESEVRANLSKSWAEVAVQSAEQPVEFYMAPDAQSPRSAAKTLLDSLIKTRPAVIKAAFLHEMNTQTSSWTYGHEVGRASLKRSLPGRVETCCYENVSPDNASEIIEQAVSAGNQVIFTTSPKLISATLRAAAEHPDVKFLNCSLNIPHPLIRSYYGRLYEAKFLSGLIAGELTRSGRIGFMADYPIYGSAANINAFALGVQMVNPDAEIFLEWSAQHSAEGIIRRFIKRGTDVISNQDVLSPRIGSREFGLYHISGLSAERVAFTYRRWGRFYELILRTILDGGWQVPSGKAINYWWGLSAGVVEIHCADTLPAGTRKLVGFMRDSLSSGAFRPFAAPLRSQDGAVLDSGELTPEQIVKMDFLLDNVHGRIPNIGELKSKSQPLVRLLGIHDEDREGTP